MHRSAEDHLHALTSFLDTWIDSYHGHTESIGALQAALDEANEFKPSHVPADYAFSRRNNERKYDL